jgi:hypothetical protein
VDARDSEKTDPHADLDRFLGEEALYREGDRFSLVRVDAFEPDEKGVAAFVSLIPTRGLWNERPPSWRIYSAWSCFGSSEDRWVAAYIDLTLDFEPGLIDAIVDRAERMPDERYGPDRAGQIYRWIRLYRAVRLSRELPGEIRLIWKGRFMGLVTDQQWAGYPEVEARFTPADRDDALRRDLEAYAHWWHNSEDVADRTLTDRLSGGWWLESSDGLRIASLIPIINFRRGTVVVRYRGQIQRG